jgi:hypothetical protein
MPPSFGSHTTLVPFGPINRWFASRPWGRHHHRKCRPAIFCEMTGGGVQGFPSSSIMDQRLPIR